LAGVFERLQFARRKSDADERPRVVEQQQAAFNIAEQIKGDFRDIGAIAGDAEQWRAVRGRGPAGRQMQCTRFVTNPLHAGRAGLVKAPLHTELVAREVIREGQTRRPDAATEWLRQGPRKVAAGGPEPAVG